MTWHNFPTRKGLTSEIVRTTLPQYFFSNFRKTNSDHSDPTLRLLAADLGWRCLPLPHTKFAWLIWLNTIAQLSIRVERKAKIRTRNLDK